ncbi:MAG: hypothetical protein KGY50_05240 [Candidatus Thermoplasmatota archaeon]|nr:hypothetical protein [Candidatus Thermoplasmatota archaeon]
MKNEKRSVFFLFVIEVSFGFIFNALLFDQIGHFRFTAAAKYCSLFGSEDICSVISMCS